MKLQDKSILLVDDEKRLTDLLTIRLEEEGAKVTAASEGSEGFRMATMTNPDVIVMDLNMPGVNGFEAIRSLRLTQPDTPILVLTGYASEGTFRSATEAGANACMGKPANLNELVAQIATLLETE